MTSPWDLTKQDYSEVVQGLPSFRLTQLWQGLYDNNHYFDEISNLPKGLRQELTERFPKALRQVAEQTSNNGQTVKWLWELSDGKTIETVLMHYKDRSTVCVSSQAGCAMGCGFCATGQAGYERNLSVGEILEQIVAARQASATLPNPKRLSNVVFMGMGEPFANYKNVMPAVDRICQDFKIGARHVTVSTIGLIPQIVMFTKRRLQVGLAVSLHAANNDLRTKLVPINKRHPIEELVVACQDYRNQTGRRVSFEWAMIKDTNDSPQDAQQLISVAKKARAHVNLIPLNPTPGWPTVGSSKETIKAFTQQLQDSGVEVTVRRNRGTDIDAACGQLQASHKATAVKLTKKEA